MIDFVRNLVLKTNNTWPFSSLNRLPYYAAVRAFAHICKDFPQIQRVYLRHGLLGRDWVPGISDIDLTVLFEPGRTVEEEFRFAVSFWNRVQQLKRYFPMLGDIDLLDSKQISSWTRFTIRGKEAASWRLIFGVGNLEINSNTTAEEDSMNSLNHALLYYFNFFVKRFLTLPRNPITVMELARISKKVMRYANIGASFETEHDLSEILCALIAGLDKQLEAFVLPPDPPIQTQIAPAMRIPPPDLKSVAAALGPFQSFIQSIYLSEQRNIVVLARHVSPRELDECIAAWKRQPALSSNSSVHIVTFRMFEYLLRFYDPFFYTHLMQNRTLAFGNDAFEQIAAPSIGAFKRCVLDQTVTILPFPTSRTFITCDNSKWHKGFEVYSWLERCLRLKLFLEHGLIPPVHAESLRQSRNHYQSYFSEYQMLTEFFSKSSLFALFRKLTHEVHCDLEAERHI